MQSKCANFGVKFKVPKNWQNSQILAKWVFMDSKTIFNANFFLKKKEEKNAKYERNDINLKKKKGSIFILGYKKF